MKILSHPLDFTTILKKKRSIKKELIKKDGLIKKRIAIVGGSTLTMTVDILELFLLNHGIEPTFFVGEFGNYLEEIFFSEELSNFSPEIIYIHTNNKNIRNFPELNSSNEDNNQLIQEYTDKIKAISNRASDAFKCPVIINNYELLPYRLLGNQDGVFGDNSYINQLNNSLNALVCEYSNLYLNDINYLSALYGLERWFDNSFYYMYKYAISAEGTVLLSDNIAKIIKAIFGKNKKAIAVDLDNTLWSGVIGDDGVDNIELSIESPTGHAHHDFALYLKKLSKLGVPLCVVSKNEHENAVAGLNHPDSILSVDDFLHIYANWTNKDINIVQIAEKINIAPDSFVFLDDNPAERQIVSDSISGIAVPELLEVENFISAVDRGGYFETVALSNDDIARNDMYKANIKREESQNNFTDYSAYLKSLDMTAIISPFDDISLERITQLINKTNQFNTTGLRMTKEEIVKVQNSNKHLSFYARLTDKFGDNGIVSAIIGDIDDDTADISLWIMSCRVFKRELEYAIFDKFVSSLNEKGVKKLTAKYILSPKNGYIKNLYTDLGFTTVSIDENSVSYQLIIENYYNKNKNIKV